MTARKKTSKLSQIRKASKTGKLTPGFITALGTRKQTGKSIEKADKQHKALQPGYRISKSGRLYYEARENRSDTPAQITAYTKSHAKTAEKPKKTTAKKTTAKKPAAKTVKAIPAPVIKATRKQIQTNRKYNRWYYDAPKMSIGDYDDIMWDGGKFPETAEFDLANGTFRRDQDDENKILFGKYKQALKKQGKKLRSLEEIKAAEEKKLRETLKEEKRQSNQRSAAEIAVDMHNAKSIAVTYFIPKGKSKRVIEKVTWTRNPKNMNEWSDSTNKTDYYSTTTVSKFIAARRQELGEMWKHDIKMTYQTKLMPAKILDTSVNPYYEGKDGFYWLHKISDKSVKSSIARGKWYLQYFKKLDATQLKHLSEHNNPQKYTWKEPPYDIGSINTSDEIAAKTEFKKLAVKYGWKQSSAEKVKAYVSSIAKRYRDNMVRIRNKAEADRRGHIAHYKNFKLPSFPGAKKILVTSKLTAATLRGCKGAAVIHESVFYKDGTTTATKRSEIYVCANDVFTNKYEISQDWNPDTKKWETVAVHMQKWNDSMKVLAQFLNDEVGLDSGHSHITTVQDNGKWIDHRPMYQYKEKGTVVYYK